MKRRTPVSTLFTCTTLFRSVRPDVVLAHGGTATQVTAASISRHRPAVVWQQILPFPRKIQRQPRRAYWWVVSHRIHGSIARSEEHTSQLQSPVHLAFRILPE